MKNCLDQTTLKLSSYKPVPDKVLTNMCYQTTSKHRMAILKDQPWYHMKAEKDYI